MTLSDNNLTGSGDIFNGSISMGEEGAFLAGSVQYRYFLPNTRTTLNFDGSLSKSQLVKHLKPFDVDGDAFSIIPGITQNFLRNRRFSLDGNAAFEIKDSKTTVGDDKVAYDRMRVLRFGPQGEIRDSQGKTRLNADMHIGIPSILGGSEAHDRLASRKSSGGQFTYYTASLSRLQKLPYHSFGILRLNTQLSPQTLNSMEQFRLGGAFSVRGYPEGDSAGDYGFGFSAEIRVPPPLIPETWKLPFAKRPFKDSFNFVGFIDGGKTYLQQRETADAEKDRLLLGAGFGFRFYFDQYVSTSLDIGYPFGDDSTDSNLPQAHFSIKVEY
jgi:hemolysin activation/secretion protein